MRFSTTARLILGIGIFAIVIGVVGWFYLQKAQEQSQLDNSLSLAQTTLPTIISQKNDLVSQLTQLESDLAQAESSLAQAKAKFPESVESIEYDEVLFDIADDCDLNITNLTASEPGDEEVESVHFSVASFTVDVRGTVAEILKFLNTIATSEYSPTETNFINATIASVNMAVTETGWTWSATINLVIYDYRGE